MRTESMMAILETFLIWVASSWLRTVSFSVAIILVFDFLIKKVSSYRDFVRKIDKLPGPPASNPVLGNIPLKVLSLLTSRQSNDASEFYTSQIQSVLGHTFIYKNEPLFRLWLGQEPVVCVWKPEIVETVLNDSFLLEKSYHYDFLRPWLGNGLLTSPGRIWRPRRKLLVPSFHFNILKAFVPVFDRKSRLMVRNINSKLSEALKTRHDDQKSTVVDITPVITACTLDAICETIMGVSIDAQENPNNDYCQSIYIVGETFLERIIQPRYWLDCVFWHTELGKLYRYHLDKLHSFTRKVISEKKSNESSNPYRQTRENDISGIVSNVKALEKGTVQRYQESKEDAPQLPKAFLDLLLEKLDSSGTQKLTDEEIREEVDTFMFEGHDTTAMALSWTLFLLGHNRDIQYKLWSEIDNFYQLNLLNKQSTELNFDQLKQLKYLDRVIKEALRLCPSVPFIGRQTTSALKLGDYDIPKGSVIFVLIYQLHRNSEIFPNPEKFDPDRFLPENTLGRHPFAYVPFSAGPRNCIGQKFAMAEMKTILMHLTRNFEFESVTPLDKAKIQMEMVLRPKCALEIRIKARNHQPDT